MLIPCVVPLHPLLSSKVATDGIGINIHFINAKPGELEMIAAAGFKWVRMDFHWGLIEHRRGEYNFSSHDHFVEELEKHKIHAYFIIDYNNKLYEKNVSVVTPEGRAAYAKFAAAAVNHYKGRGIIWEIWNEPNIARFWKPHPNVTQYTEMALEAVKEIRTKAPNEVIIGPAAANDQLFHFIESCVKSGLLNYWDAISIHPYGAEGPERVTVIYKKLRNIIAKYTPKGKTIPIISGEWGYSDIWNSINRTVQGKYLSRELLINIKNHIPISVWYDWHDDGTNKTNPEHHFGIVEYEYHQGHDPIYTPKPAYFAAKTLTSFLNGYHYIKRIASTFASDYILLFSNDHDFKMAVWTSSVKSHEIEIPSDNCDFEIIYSENNKHETITAKNGHLSLNISDDFPIYLKSKCPNHVLLNAPEAHFFDITIIPIHGKELSVRVYSTETHFKGTIYLTDIKGFEPLLNEIQIEFTDNDLVKTFVFPLKSKPENDYTIGIRINGSDGYDHKFPAQRFHSVPDHIITNCEYKTEGHGKSEVSISVNSAPKPLPESNSSVLKIDYHLYNDDHKIVIILPKIEDDRKIPDKPKAFGIWVYGDGHRMFQKMRVLDMTPKGTQIFQLQSNDDKLIDWYGWKYVVFDFRHQIHWGGTNDGIVRYPLKILELYAIENWQKIQVKSTIYITAPVYIY